MDATTKAKPPTGARQDDPKTAPKPGPQEAPPKAPTDPLQAILERARQGDQSVLPQLKQVLDDNESLWRDCYDLVAMSEQAWLDKIVGKDLLASQSFRRHVVQLKLDLVGPSPTPLEKLLADRIAAAWLGVHHAETMEALGDASGGKAAQMRLKRLESANKRFQAATKALAVARRLTNGLKIEINHTTASPAPAVGETVAASRAAHARNPVTRSNADAGVHDPVRERLRTLFNEEADLAEGRELADAVRP